MEHRDNVRRQRCDYRRNNDRRMITLMFRISTRIIRYDFYHALSTTLNAAMYIFVRMRLCNFRVQTTTIMITTQLSQHATLPALQ